MMAILIDVRLYFIVVFICISLIMSHLEHIFIYLLAICMFSLGRCLLGLLPISWLGYLFIWYWAPWAVGLSQRSPLSIASFVNMFSYYQDCFFFFLLFIVSFTVQKFLNLTKFHLFFVYLFLFLPLQRKIKIIKYIEINLPKSFPGCSDGKESACNAGDWGSIPRLKIPWRRKQQHTVVFLSGKSHGWRSLVGCSPWGC